MVLIMVLRSGPGARGELARGDRSHQVRRRDPDADPIRELLAEARALVEEAEAIRAREAAAQAEAQRLESAAGGAS